MTEVLHFPSSPTASSPSSSSSSPSPSSLSYTSRSNATLLISSDHRRRNPVPGFSQDVDFQGSIDEHDLRRRSNDGEDDGGSNGGEDQLSLLALLVAIFRRSLISCKSNRRELCSMEIGWPTNVRHVAHVTFDRFNGFLGLPVEFEPEVPRRAPSARYIVQKTHLFVSFLQLGFQSSLLERFYKSLYFGNLTVRLAILIFIGEKW